ncbi:cell division protein FtsZ [Pelodictyon luteolum]|uniref:Cell division protein FtsZ n=1 Tax=Chlorobium luteolum (strain DSM 273 / BCRC 81028 / 2530) TaxID=319225 RepID=Q3B134_CHLL3|nr:cell division protein FtsZ [Pelodictyon luteolum]ABB24947.1 cell division protein FtsZ [Pelodictyon luteolum DSM 273]
MAFELDPGLFDSDQSKGVTIRIVGVGGCGGNAVNNMIDRKISGVEYIVMNTDRQALLNSKAPLRVQIGRRATGGLGAGADPAQGRQAADDDRDIIAAQLEGADMVFITAGMGKGTGTGAAPVIASIARNMGILTIGVVTRPFGFEGDVKARIADGGIAELRKYIDTLIIVENEKILSIAEEGVSATEAYNMANDVLYRAAKGIADIITSHGHVNVDFADVRSIMSGAGDAVMGSAAAAGERCALKAASDALGSPLLEGISINGSKGVLVNITGGVSMRDLSEAMSFIAEQAGGEAKIINGYVDEQLVGGEVRVTVIVTGFKRKDQEPPKPREREEPPAMTSGMRTVPPRQHRSHQMPFAAQQGAAAERPDEDLRVPAYIRKNIQISGPYDAAGRMTDGQGGGFGRASAGRNGEHEDIIQKGQSDLPAHLRRTKNWI